MSDRFIGDSGQEWIVDVGNIDLVGTEWVADTGVQSIDLHGWERGSLYTDVQLEVGEYALTFCCFQAPRCYQ